MIKKSILQILFVCMMTITMVFSQITDGCDLPSSNTMVYLHVNSNGTILYNSSEAIAGFEFIIDGLSSNAEVSVTGAASNGTGADGDAGDAGLIVQTQYNTVEGYKVVAFGIGVSLPSGCGTLVDFDVTTGTFTSLSSIVISGTNANNLPAEHYEVVSGCMDDGGCTVATCGYDSPHLNDPACNYNSNANIDDGSCIYRTYDDPTTNGEFEHEGTNCDGELVIINLNSIPSEFNISQNFPNPFNPSTNISFTIANLDEISLIVYDLSGKEIITLASGLFTPGSYLVNWNAVNNFGKAISSGMYVYRYVTSEKIITKKMLYLK